MRIIFYLPKRFALSSNFENMLLIHQKIAGRCEMYRVYSAHLIEKECFAQVALINSTGR